MLSPIAAMPGPTLCLHVGIMTVIWSTYHLAGSHAVQPLVQVGEAAADLRWSHMVMAAMDLAFVPIESFCSGRPSPRHVFLSKRAPSALERSLPVE